MGISVEEAQKAIELWLAECICENHLHDTTDAREKKKEGKNRLFIRPAINRELKSDIRWLNELAGNSDDRHEFISRLKDYILYRKDEYGRGREDSPIGKSLPEHLPWPNWGPIYYSVAPILCADCAKEIGLIEVVEWHLVTYDIIKCSKCNNQWDPFDDLLPGANLSLNPPDPWCVACCLREAPTVKDALMKERHDQIEEAYDNSKLGNKAETIQEKRRKRREENGDVLEEFLAYHASCKECGEDEPKLLNVLPGPNSPKGTLATWRRDATPETFKKRLDTALIICQDCK